MSTFPQQTDLKQARSLRAWSTENLKRHLTYCRENEVAPGMHKEARRMYKQSQAALETELARRIGVDWEDPEDTSEAS